MTHLTAPGRFMARLEGPTSGNVLVRRTQYRWVDAPDHSARLTQAFLTGKIANARLVLRRGGREMSIARARTELAQAADRLSGLLTSLRRETTVDGLRGVEGEAGRVYWAAFPSLLGGGDPAIGFTGRNPRMLGD